MGLKNRDDSVEIPESGASVPIDVQVEQSPGKAEKRPTRTHVEMGMRAQITKSARRFERYGHVVDGQDLVRLIGQVTPELNGREPYELVPDRHKKD